MKINNKFEVLVEIKSVMVKIKEAELQEKRKNSKRTGNPSKVQI